MKTEDGGLRWYGEEHGLMLVNGPLVEAASGGGGRGGLLPCI